MSTRPEAVLFDLDGTLVDTAGDLVAALYATCDEFRRPRPIHSKARQQVSNGGAGLIGLAFGDVADHPQALEKLLSHYATNIAVWSSVFRPLDALITQFDDASIPWGIVTNKTEALSVSLLNALSIRPTRECIVGGDTLAQRKPDPAPLLHAAQYLGAEPTRCVYVGDHRRDMDAARAAGMISIAAAYGYVPDEDPADGWQADHVAVSPSDVITILARIGMPVSEVARR